MSAPEPFWHHKFSPNAEGDACLCGLPKEHPAHTPPNVDTPDEDAPHSQEGD